MSLGQIFASADISASGLQAERMRMEVAANNIANSHATRSSNGGPYRRQQVIFATELERASTGDHSNSVAQLGGVNVVGIEPDQSPLPKVYNPGHPDADLSGYVQMPNVILPMEMIDLMTASRSYEANLKASETFRQMAEQTLNLMKGLGT